MVTILDVQMNDNAGNASVTVIDASVNRQIWIVVTKGKIDDECAWVVVRSSFFLFVTETWNGRTAMYATEVSYNFNSSLSPFQNAHFTIDLYNISRAYARIKDPDFRNIYRCIIVQN